ncbi:UDP-N-acetylglucosamine-N-acetylmuramylpentapeptide N-acetylglucosamine transferase [Abditibacterium utsteinense]|uniref:UDP-N-acetylglucosamine--N-acetylmuramyl-(pentapeptide) pyrophosphoryl-undecaprenol N-acetylglucosamine transferase n=1 Tax=Abditibacterium utsteinense TaxID=1960156 RepID=A0A2S8SVC9_9BACT|nr:undecaprenyldiphospho-muramoylpentapeptide beta-N-acetylglucosaminyltransferase [Abditibacterium utsteinense]PQV64750.1 UDP-N-acetylglucosamine-N-acetylmuramylpentapeptide N-acetylglucosamine transferase [Abditibacterium utsteinense]
MKTKILVTGGGTSGHISPALALIQTLRKLDSNLEFLYIGSKTGMEKNLVEAANVPFVAISTGKLRRYLSFENLVDQTRIPIGIFQSLVQVKRFKPDVVLATGGSVAVPPVVAAAFFRVPILIHEQTVQIGLANQINARFATKIALSWDGALGSLPSKFRQKAWVAGNPVRAAIFGGEKAKAVEFFSLSEENLPTIYVTGGSLGARVINRAVEAALPELLQVAKIIHQCGQQPAGDEQDFDRLTRAAQQLPENLRARYALTRFVKDELRHVFTLADLVVSRAGASTVTELCALGKPALYIPLVPTGGDEQTKNAQMCEKVGAAQIVLQSEVSGAAFPQKIKELLGDGAKLEAMSRAAKTLAKPDAARDIARAVLDLAHKK